jgi:hypothetical protein
VVSIGVRERVLGNSGDRRVHRFAELTTEIGAMSLVPVFRPHQIELGRSTDEDR